MGMPLEDIHLSGSVPQCTKLIFLMPLLYMRESLDSFIIPKDV